MTRTHLRPALSTVLVTMLFVAIPSMIAGDDNTGPRTPSTGIDKNGDHHDQKPGTQGPASTPPMSIGSIGPQVPIVVPDLEHLLCVGAAVVGGASLEEALEACG